MRFRVSVGTCYAAHVLRPCSEEKVEYVDWVWTKVEDYVPLWEDALIGPLNSNVVDLPDLSFLYHLSLRLGGLD